MARSASQPDVSPSVLVVLVARNAAAWLPETLHALSRQTYSRLGVIAVDNASSDGTREQLAQALGARRVLSLAENRGVAGSVIAALDVQVAREADYILILHDDAVLDADAVERLVEAASLEEVERVGIVGPKVVDWDDPRVLREVGRSTDRFGHPYTPLQDGELDQGQFDRVLEVLFVSSAAMLVSRECLHRTGPPDQRFASHHEDLDFCWRARLAGFRVLMTPLARVRHLSAAAKGRRHGDRRPRSERYFGERAGLASMLKNYGVRSLVWLLPVYAVFGLLRLALLALARRFEDAYELLAAWGWNIAHLPSTLRRRLRAQSVRAVPDRSIRRFMETAGMRLPRWFETVGVILEEQRELEERNEGQPVSRRLRHQGASLIRSHPVALASLLAALVFGFAFRSFVGPDRLEGGAVALFPSAPHDFFAELVSAFRTTGLGGSQPGSPALAVMGGLSSLLFRSPELAQKAMLVGLPLVASVLMYRAVARQTGSAFAGVAAASAYALSGLMLWAISDGRIELLVVVALLPAIADRLEWAFGPDAPRPSVRFIVGAGALLALAVSFFPGALLAVGVVLASQVLGGRSRARGSALALAAIAVGALLVFPMIPSLSAAGAHALGSGIGGTDVAPLARLALGAGPGTGLTAWFLPVAAALGLLAARPEHSGRAWRAAFAAIAALGLAWLSASGYLPGGLSNAPAYLVAAAVSEASLVGAGAVSILGVRSETFGARQIVGALLTLVVVGGLLSQSFLAGFGGWTVGGPEALSPAWAVVASQQEGEYRVLWLGAAGNRRPFPSPGGDPQGTAAGLRYAITGPEGVVALDDGRSSSGPGDDALRATLAELMSGDTRHAGALLAPFGIRIVVGAQSDLPPRLLGLLSQQVDLDRLDATGLVIFRDPAALPPAAVTADQGAVALARSGTLGSISMLQATKASPLRSVTGGYDGSGPGTVLLASEFSSAWRVEGEDAAPSRAFGWATMIPATTADEIRVRYSGQLSRTIEMGVLGLLWAIALWITRKPVSR